jgi:hypothetical protein
MVKLVRRASQREKPEEEFNHLTVQPFNAKGKLK